MATYAFTLNGSPIFPKRGTMRIHQFSNGSDLWTFHLDSLDGSLTAERGDVCIATENGTKVMAGEVKTARRRWLGSKDWSGIVTEVVVTSYDDYTSRRIVDDSFASGTVKALLTSLNTDYLNSDYGTTIHASQADGITLPELTATRVVLRDFLDKLYTYTLWPWRIDYDNKLRMMPPSANPAPFDIADDDGNVIGDLTRTPTQEDSYANHIIGVFSGAGPQTSSETFTANGGSTATYTTKYPAVQQPNSIWPNELRVNGVNRGPVGWGNDGSSWYWSYTTHQLIHNGTGYVPANGDTIAVTYAIGYPFTLEASDAGEIAAHGTWDKLVTIPEDMTLDAAQDYIDAILAESVVIPEQITYETFGLGLVPGMRQHIQNTERDLDDDCVITSIVASDVGRADYTFKRLVTLVMGDVVKGKLTTTLENTFRRGGGGQLEISGGGAMAAGQRYSVQAYGAGGSFYGDDQVLFDFDGDGTNYGTGLRPASLFASGTDDKYQLVLKNADLAASKALTFWQQSDGDVLISMQSLGGLRFQTLGLGDPYIALGSADRILLETGGVEAGVIATYQFCADGFSLRDFQWSSGDKTVDNGSSVGFSPPSIFRYTGSASVTLNLAAIAAATSRVETSYCRVIEVVHDGTAGVLTVDPNSTETIGNGTAAATTVALTPGQSVRISMVSGTNGGVKILASHGLPPAASSGGIQIATVTLTDAQIKALPTTPITIVPAPPAGYRIKGISASLSGNFAAGAYTNINTTYADLTIASAGGGTVFYGIVNDTGTDPDLTKVSDFLGSANHRIIDPPLAMTTTTDDGAFGYVVMNGPDAYAAVEADLVRIQMDNNGSGNLTGGNSANTLKVTLYYCVEAL